MLTAAHRGPRSIGSCIATDRTGQGRSAGAISGGRGSSPLPPLISPETGLQRRRRRLSSESGVKLVVREVRYKTRREIRLQVLVKKLPLVRLGLPRSR